jgi:hypothetical protein
MSTSQALTESVILTVHRVFLRTYFLAFSLIRLWRDTTKFKFAQAYPLMRDLPSLTLNHSRSRWVYLPFSFATRLIEGRTRLREVYSFT